MFSTTRVGHAINQIQDSGSHPDNHPVESSSEGTPSIEEKSIPSGEPQQTAWSRMPHIGQAMIVSFLPGQDVLHATSVNRQALSRFSRERDLLFRCGKLNAEARKIVTTEAFLDLLKEITWLPPELRSSVLKTLACRIAFLPLMSRRAAAIAMIDIAAASPELSMRSRAALLALLSEQIQYVVDEGRQKVFHAILAAMSTLPFFVQTGALQQLIGELFRLPLEARSETFYEVLSAIYALQQNEHVSLPQQQTGQLPESGHAAIQSLFNPMLEAVSNLPVNSQIAPLWYLIGQLGHLPTEGRGDAFSSFVKLLPQLPLDRQAESLQHLSRQISFLPQESKSGAFCELLDAGFALPADVQVSAFKCVGEQMISFIPEVMPKAFGSFLGAIQKLSESRQKALLKFLISNMPLLPPDAVQDACKDVRAAISMLSENIRDVLYPQVDEVMTNILPDPSNQP